MKFSAISLIRWVTSMYLVHLSVSILSVLSPLKMIHISGKVTVEIWYNSHGNDMPIIKVQHQPLCKSWLDSCRTMKRKKGDRILKLRSNKCKVMSLLYNNSVLEAVFMMVCLFSKYATYSGVKLPGVRNLTAFELILCSGICVNNN